MKTNDENYVKLNDLWWEVLNLNKDVSRFRDEFFDAALNDGYELSVIEDYWRM